MYTLYGSPSTAGTAIHWLLLELGVPFEARMLDFEAGEHKASAYLAINPDGVVPTLIIDGAPVTEMAAIATLLAERHPEAGFAPAVGSPERAAYLSWSFWLANGLQPRSAPGSTRTSRRARRAPKRLRFRPAPASRRVWPAWTPIWPIATSSSATASPPSTCWRPSCVAGAVTCPSPRPAGPTSSAISTVFASARRCARFMRARA
jgi:hypothetical protein